MWGKRRIEARLADVDRKLERDDQVINQLADVVLQLRVATHEAEHVLRRLQEHIAEHGALFGKEDEQ